MSCSTQLIALMSHRYNNSICIQVFCFICSHNCNLVALIHKLSGVIVNIRNNLINITFNYLKVCIRRIMLILHTRCFRNYSCLHPIRYGRVYSYLAYNLFKHFFSYKARTEYCWYILTKVYDS